MIGQRWKHSNVLPSRLVLIGRGLAHKHASHPLYNSETAHHHGVLFYRVSVVIASWGTPGPIPNPEAKPDSADGTATEGLWESRTPPNTTSHNPAPVETPTVTRGRAIFIPTPSAHAPTRSAHQPTRRVHQPTLPVQQSGAITAVIRVIRRRTRVIGGASRVIRWTTRVIGWTTRHKERAGSSALPALSSGAGYLMAEPACQSAQDLDQSP